MKKTILLGLSLLAVLASSGCAVAVRSEPFYPPVVVAGPDVVVMDYWFDGSAYYYYDGGVGLYFFYDGFGVRHWCGRGWAPRGEWRRHDGGWRGDAGWGRGREGGRFPGEGGRRGPVGHPGGGHRR